MKILDHNSRSVHSLMNQGDFLSLLPFCGILSVRSYSAISENLNRRILMIDATVQVRKRGVLTLPAELRQKYDIEEGDTFRLVDLDGVFVITPMVPMVPELAREIEQLRQEAGLSIKELLETLRQERERYYQEKYETEP
jgi:bifunctional DNA-binding transcriptional regulator/antitoxin component of YhaV-PrlF toxin-antitoxin module